MAKETNKDTPLNCFVIMPISEPEYYETGHFNRVYSHLIKPACTAAGVMAIRADDIKNTNYIVIDILKRILKSDIVICDLSAKNPNVMYELGIRQAFNLPAVLIKDKKTERVFDIQGLRTVEYDENLRVDIVEKDILNLITTIKQTIEENGKDINSLIQLLRIPQAEINVSTEISPETNILLEYIKDISQRITKIEDKLSEKENVNTKPTLLRRRRLFTLPIGENVSIGDVVYTEQGGAPLGYFQGKQDNGFIISKEKDGSKEIVVTPDQQLYKTMSIIPF